MPAHGLSYLLESHRKLIHLRREHNDVRIFDRLPMSGQATFDQARSFGINQNAGKRTFRRTEKGRKRADQPRPLIRFAAREQTVSKPPI